MLGQLLEFAKKQPSVHFATVTLIILGPACLSSGCKPAAKKEVIPTETIIFLGGTKESNRRGDVIFVHGLGGDPKGTWQPENSEFYMPRELGEDFPDVGIWALSYSASPSEWLGGTMPLLDRSKNLLEQLRLNKFSENNLIFVGHSLGGLVIKQVLRDAFTQSNQAWEEMGEHTKGVVFLATPHTGSDAANLGSFLNRMAPALRTTVTIHELESNAEILRDLNVWYRNNIPDREIVTSVLFETRPMPHLSSLVVDQNSSDPGINGVTPIGVLADHGSICKPSSKDDLVYKSVSDFIAQHLTPSRPRFDISFGQFVEEFEAVRKKDNSLEAFKKEHVGQKVKWIAVVKKVHPDKKSPSYSIIPKGDAIKTDQVVIAGFSPKNFREDILAGTSIEIEGVLKKQTNSGGAILHECKILAPIKAN